MLSSAELIKSIVSVLIEIHQIESQHQSSSGNPQADENVSCDISGSASFRGTILLPCIAGATFRELTTSIERRLTDYCILHVPQEAEAQKKLLKGKKKQSITVTSSTSPNLEGKTPLNGIPQQHYCSHCSDILNHKAPSSTSTMDTSATMKPIIRVVQIHRSASAHPEAAADKDSPQYEVVPSASDSEEIIETNQTLRCFFSWAMGPTCQSEYSPLGKDDAVLYPSKPLANNVDALTLPTRLTVEVGEAMVRVGCGGAQRDHTVHQLVIQRLEQRQGKGRVISRVVDVRTGAAVLPCERAAVMAAITPSLRVDFLPQPEDVSDKEVAPNASQLTQLLSDSLNGVKSIESAAHYYGEYEGHTNDKETLISMPSITDDHAEAEAIERSNRKAHKGRGRDDNNNNNNDDVFVTYTQRYSVWSLGDHSSLLHDDVSDLSMADIDSDGMIYRVGTNSVPSSTSHISFDALSAFTPTQGIGHGTDTPQRMQQQSKTDFGFDDGGGIDNSPAQVAFRSLYTSGLLDESTRSFSGTPPPAPKPTAARGDSNKYPSPIPPSYRKRPRDTASETSTSTSPSSSTSRAAEAEECYRTPLPYLSPRQTPRRLHHESPEVLKGSTTQPRTQKNGAARGSADKECATPSTALAMHDDVHRHRSPIEFTPGDMPPSSTAVSDVGDAVRFHAEDVTRHILLSPIHGLRPRDAVRAVDTSPASHLLDGLLTMTPPSPGDDDSPGVMMTQQTMADYVGVGSSTSSSEYNEDSDSDSESDA